MHQLGQSLVPFKTLNILNAHRARVLPPRILYLCHQTQHLRLQFLLPPFGQTLDALQLRLPGLGEGSLRLSYSLLPASKSIMVEDDRMHKAGATFLQTHPLLCESHAIGEPSRVFAFKSKPLTLLNHL